MTDGGPPRAVLVVIADLKAMIARRQLAPSVAVSQTHEHAILSRSVGHYFNPQRGRIR